MRPSWSMSGVYSREALMEYEWSIFPVRESRRISGVYSCKVIVGYKYGMLGFYGTLGQMLFSSIAGFELFTIVMASVFMSTLADSTRRKALGSDISGASLHFPAFLCSYICDILSGCCGETPSGDRGDH